MVIAKKDLKPGVRVFHRELQHAAGGAAAQARLVACIVREVQNSCARVETENGKTRTVPFSQLEPDRAWERERQEQDRKKRERIAQEREPVPLTCSLGEALEHKDAAAAPAVSDDVRARALRQLEDLKQASASAPAPAPASTQSHEDMRSRRLTAVEKEDVVRKWDEALAAGFSTREAAELAGVHATSCRRYSDLKKAGLPLTDSLPGRVLGSRSRTPAERRSIALSCLRDYGTIAEASIGLNLNVSIINTYLKALAAGELGPVPPEALVSRTTGRRRGCAPVAAELAEASAPVVEAPAAPPAPAVRLVPPEAPLPPPVPAATEPSENEKKLMREVRHLRAELAHAHEAPSAAAPELERALADARAENERLRARIAKLLTLIAED